MAKNCWVNPTGIVVFAIGTGGKAAVLVRVMDISVARVTVKTVEPEMLPYAAVIVVVPAEAGVAIPLAPAVLLMEETDETAEDHVTDVVRFCAVPSEKVPVAVNCRLPPRAMLGFAGLTAIDTSVA